MKKLLLFLLILFVGFELNAQSYPDISVTPYLIDLGLHPEGYTFSAKATVTNLRATKTSVIAKISGFNISSWASLTPTSFDLEGYASNEITINGTFLTIGANNTGGLLATVQFFLDGNILPDGDNIMVIGQIESSSTPILTVTPTSTNVSYTSGTTSFNVSNTGTGTMNWSAISNASWITITGGSSGTNSGTINVSYAANTGLSRSGTITVTASGASGSPKTITINQTAVTYTPILTVTPTSTNVSYTSGTTSFNVSNTGTGTMNWSAISNASWITITGGSSGTNSGTINVSYAANTGSSRSGTITVTASGASGSPKTITINQAAIPVKYTVTTSCNPSNGGTATGGGIFDPGQSITLTANENVGWKFLNWLEGNSPVSNSLSYQFSVTSNKYLIANFNKVTENISDKGPISSILVPDISFISARIYKEHQDLTDGNISPGEDFEIYVKLKNNSDGLINIQNIVPVTENTPINLEENMLGQLGMSINSKDTKEYTYPVFIKIINWPYISSFEIKFKISYSINLGISREIITKETYPLTISVPPLNKTLSIPELQNAIAHKTINYGDIVATEYIPFIKVDRCNECDGLKAGVLITGIYTGLLEKTFEEVIKDKLTTDLLKNKAIEYLVNSVFSEESKLRYIYTVAGINHSFVTSPYSNFFQTNSPIQWEIPKINKPVKVIAKLKKLEDYTTSIFSSSPEFNLPFLEPLVFVETTNMSDGSIYLATSNSRPQDKTITQDGIVHQTWKEDNSDNYYFTLVTIKDDPAGGVPIIGSLLNVLYDRQVIRTIYKVNNLDMLPEIGSTVRAKGIYKYTGLSSLVPLPSNWTGEHPQRWYVDCSNVSIIAGAKSSISNLGKEFFNTDNTNGNISWEMETTPTSLTKISSTTEVNTIADVHLYDSEGNHTEGIYDDQGNLLYYENSIPGSFFGLLSNNKQFIYLEYANTFKYIFQIKQKISGSSNLCILTADTLSTNPLVNIINNDIKLTSTDLIQQQINLTHNINGAIVPASFQSKALCNTFTWQKIWMSDNNAVIDIYLGDLTDGQTVDNFIDLTSFNLNKTLPPIINSVIVLDSNSNFLGKAIKMSFKAKDALSTLDSLVLGNHIISINFKSKDGIEYESGFVISLVEQVTSAGDITHTEIPKEYKLNQNYPNPFNPSTTIKYLLKESGHVKLSIYNITGQEISVLVDGYKEAGTYEAEVKLKDASSGIYFYRLQTNGYTEVKKMILMK